MEAQYVRAYVHRLRAKLDDGPGTLIRTISGIGYTVNSVPDAS
jgi:DNA-binding response OmpR family regulator